MLRWITLFYFALLVGIIIMADVGARIFSVIHQVPMGDKIGHFFLIGFAAFLLNLWLKCRIFTVGRSRWLWGSAVLSVVVSLEEFLQVYLPHRNSSIWDLAADILGIIVFGQLARWVHSRADRRRYAGEGKMGLPGN
jgi:polysaccharide biosynthesis protein VpsQ